MEISLNNMKHRQPKTSLITAIGVLLPLGIFLIDLKTPLGIADGISYVAVVLLTIWIPDRRHVYYAAVIGVTFILLGFFFSPMGEDMRVVISNRTISVIGVVAAAAVILLYKRSQEAAAKNKEQMEALFMHANEGILIIDAAGKIVLANPGSLHLFNSSDDEVLGKKLREFLPEFPETDLVPVKNNLPDSGDQKQEGTAFRKGVGYLPVEFSFSHYTTSEGAFTVVFVIDITRRKADEEALLRMNHDLEITAQELKRSNTELENFAYISSHDLQEPLRKIQSFGHRLKEMEGKNLAEQSADYLDRMLNASSRMQNLINDLLLFSRVTNRKNPFTLVNLDQVVNQVMTDLEIALEQSQAQIESELSGVVVQGDMTQMHQLFQNLLSNAIKFRRENIPLVIKIHAEIFEPQDHPDKKFVRIFFEDNGIGFDEKYADRIFTIFQRLEGNKYQGSGIGLTICKKIVHYHGGNIAVKSEPGKGSCFIVTLPCTQQHPVTEEFISKINTYEK